MSSTSRALSVHGVGLVLSVPLLFLWLQSPDGSITGAQIFGMLAVATVYALVAMMGRPTSFYEGAQRMGVGSRSLQLLLLTVASVMICIPFLDSDDQTLSMIGLGILIASATLYVLALRSALSWRNESTPEAQ